MKLHTLAALAALPLAASLAGCALTVDHDRSTGYYYERPRDRYYHAYRYNEPARVYAPPVRRDTIIVTPRDRYSRDW